MNRPSDTQIRHLVRSLLVRQWVDLRGIEIGCFGGAVRLQGVLRHVGKLASTPADAAKAEFLASELRRIRGVRRVQLDFEFCREIDRLRERVADAAPSTEGEALDLSPGRAMPPRGAAA